MSDKIPPWDCRNDEMRNRFKDWTIKQLKLLDEQPPSADQKQFELDMMTDDGYNEDALNNDKRMRDPIINAINDAIRGRKADPADKMFHASFGKAVVDEATDFETLVKLVESHPMHTRFALWQLWLLAHRPPPDKKDKKGEQKKNNRGRKAGEPGRDSPSPYEREQLRYAAEDEQRIRWIWKHTHPARKQNRKEKPTALEIAAELNGITPSDLINWKKSHQLLTFCVLERPT